MSGITSCNNLYNNNHESTPDEPQCEPINLSEPTPSIKREPESRDSPSPSKTMLREDNDRERHHVSNPMSPSSSPPPTTTHITIDIRDDGNLFVSMEINGVRYEGVLFAQNSSNHTNNNSSTVGA